MTATLPAEAYVAALAGFERMTSRRLHVLLAHHDPAEAFAMVAGVAPPVGLVAALLRSDPDLARHWRSEAQRRQPAGCWSECRQHGIDVVLRSDRRFPSPLLDDPAAPAALFARGDLDVLDARRVGIVGTRNATQRGRQTAARLGYELAAGGAVVVSGLARGIDGAAHRGVLAARADTPGAAPPVGVVGNGLDQPYPRRHAQLWDDVARHGALISEWPPGTQPDAYRFPLRNRILAALVEVLVVVESRERGGSLITARAAAERGIPVFAVPGSLDSPASAGTNLLLVDGAAPAVESADVLMALGLDGRRAGRARFDPRPLPRGRDAEVVAWCRERPQRLDEVAGRGAMSLSDAALVLARLERDGWLREAGGWFEAIDTWADLA